MCKLFETTDFTLWDEYLIPCERYAVLLAYSPLAQEPGMIGHIINTAPGFSRGFSNEKRVTPRFDPYYNDILPSYCNAFKAYLGYRLSTCMPIEVRQILDSKFPSPDRTDCDYLADIISEIKIDIDRGWGFDPGNANGMDDSFPADPAIHVNIESAYRWLERNREEVAKAHIIKPKTTAKEPVKMPLPVSPRSINRPASSFERQELAEAYYGEMRKYFKSKDYTEWQEIELPNGEVKNINYEEVILPYCRLYPKMLGHIFSCIDYMDVPNVLDKHFKNPDLIDIDYINDVFNDIQGILDSNYSFSTTAWDGIDYYNGFKNESEMFNLSFENVDTSNKNLVRFVTPNLERARKWLARAEVSNKQTTPTQEEPVQKASAPNFSKEKSNTPQYAAEISTIEWQGSIADLAEVFYRLARAGMIDLATPRGPEGNMLGVCRQICQLFRVPPKAQDGAVKNLYAYLNKFSTEQLAPGPIDEAALPKAIGRKYTNKNTQHLNTTLRNLRPTNEDE